MASISNPPKTAAPAAKPAPAKAATPAPVAAKAPIKAPIAAKPVPPKVIAPVTAPVKAEAPAQEKPAKVVKPPKEVVLDPTTGLAVNQPTSFRWVCLEALRETWPESGKLEDYNAEATVEACKRIYAERGGKKDHSDEVWAKQALIMRAWLRSKGIAKPLPGDVAVRAPMSDEDRAALKERLAAGRAKKAATKGATASVDEQDEAAVEEE